MCNDLKIQLECFLLPIRKEITLNIYGTKQIFFKRVNNFYLVEDIGQFWGESFTIKS